MELYGKVVYAIQMLANKPDMAEARYRTMFCTAGLFYHIVHKDSKCGGYDVVRFENTTNKYPLCPRSRVAIGRIKDAYRMANISVGVVMDDDRTMDAIDDAEWEGQKDVPAFTGDWRDFGCRTEGGKNFELTA